MSNFVLDASALLALLHLELGAELVAQAIAAGAAISAVNLCEVVGKLTDAGMPNTSIHAALDPLGLAVIAFDAELAHEAGRLRQMTRQAGLSLGDRACLALAAQLGVPALTTDRAWAGLPVNAAIQILR